jgi:hypothetical protein
MAHKNRHGSKRPKPHTAAHAAAFRAPPAPPEKKVPVVYGKPFVVLEDAQKGTFVYQGGQWIPHTRTIAECRQDSQVKQLAQKINGMTRYEVCSSVTVTA